uniref:Selenoprotein F n=1 Tax=Capra hircus TaxID=9925 RepID=A0A8C2PI69_CAPHI
MAGRPEGWLGPAFGLRLLLATVLQTVSALGAEFSSESCRELGFSSNLLCSSCDLLGQFNLLQLDPDCRGCCQEEAQFETKKGFTRSIKQLLLRSEFCLAVKAFPLANLTLSHFHQSYFQFFSVFF